MSVLKIHCNYCNGDRWCEVDRTGGLPDVCFGCMTDPRAEKPGRPGPDTETLDVFGNVIGEPV